MNKAGSKLMLLTGKKHVFFTDRGNSAIKLSLKLAKSLGKTKLLLQDQGGWITYEQYAKELKFQYRLMDTDYGLVKLDVLKAILDKDTAVLMNSMPGYYCVQEDMEKISALCKKTGAFLINDVSGSIGKGAAKHGDIILGSFGEWKPIEVGYGGFAAYDDTAFTGFFTENFKRERKDFFEKLNEEIDGLPAKLKNINEKTKMIKSQLKSFDIIHRESDGLNVIVRFGNDEERMKILEFCRLYGYEFKLCPMYIKVNEQAISLEVKRG
ncbi:MAG: DegT/DnrJ/EryC1/StrS family aminotransferase [Candidatus Woesearchaeota archaeon]|nr:DegT/DnrJ/EryC1/StrS family aminotransferase [Candidatus Woesearchaeota archaeon]